jgi:DNA modification methylase
MIEIDIILDDDLAPEFPGLDASGMLRILQGDALEQLQILPAQSIQCCVTSPPYWGLRDYGTAQWEGGDVGCDHKEDLYNSPGKKFVDGSGRVGSNCTSWTDRADRGGKLVCSKCGARRIDSQLGLEATPEEYIANMVTVFREVWRVLRNDGTLWVNMGDSYAVGKQGRDDNNPEDLARRASAYGTGTGNGCGPRTGKQRSAPPGLKPKDLCMMPARLAMALQADGWYLRSEIVWHKPNPMPESVTDRPTKAHEMIYLFAKNGGKPLIWRARDTAEWSYNPDLSEVIKVGKGRAKTPAGWDISDGAHDGIEGNYSDGKTRWREAKEDEVPRWKGFDYFYDAEAIRETGEKPAGKISCISRLYEEQNSDPKGGGFRGAGGLAGKIDNGFRNKRSVWTIATQPYAEAHFATFPEEIPKLCILAGSKPGDTVLDPFAGSGAVGKVALELGRQAILIELNPKYIQLIEDRTRITIGMF